jgi:hypothetical protein
VDDPVRRPIPMTKSAASTALAPRAELQAWYLGHLRPRLVEAVVAGVVRPGAVEELDLQVAGLFELPERRFAPRARRA